METLVQHEGSKNFDHGQSFFKHIYVFNACFESCICPWLTQNCVRPAGARNVTVLLSKVSAYIPRRAASFRYVWALVFYFDQK